MPDFWRHPTDNDIGWEMPKRLSYWQSAHDRLQLQSIKLEDDNSITVHHSSGINFEEVTGYKKFDLVMNYRLRADGALMTKVTFTPQADDLPLLPRLGLRASLSAGFDQVSWHGRGPEETYFDRKQGSPVGVYQKQISNMYHPYMRPQETGNLTDVRWLQVSGGSKSLMLRGNPVVSATVLDVPPAELVYDTSKNRHGHLVRRTDTATLRIDFGQMGVGGDNSWGKWPMEKYRLPAKPYVFSFTLMPSAQ